MTSAVNAKLATMTVRFAASVIGANVRSCSSVGVYVGLEYMLHIEFSHAEGTSVPERSHMCFKMASKVAWTREIGRAVRALISGWLAVLRVH